ncbi:unnamed protein product [Calypogeia fissa]
MSTFQNYSFQDLEPTDRTQMAAVLTAIYIEGMGYGPPNPNWDANDRRSSYSIGFFPTDRSFIAINVFEPGRHPWKRCLFLVNTRFQTVTWLRGMCGPFATMVPKVWQPFLSELTARVHDIGTKPEKALDLNHQREEEEEEAAKCYETNKERIDAELELEDGLKRKRIEVDPYDDGGGMPKRSDNYYEPECLPVLGRLFFGSRES